MSRRNARVNELIRDEVSDILARSVRDPRLNTILSITNVSTSPDLRHAKIFVSVLGNTEKKEEALRGLQSASGFLRRELGKRLSLRHIPELSFQRDDSLETGARVHDLINKVAREETKKEEG